MLVCTMLEKSAPESDLGEGRGVLSSPHTYVSSQKKAILGLVGRHHVTRMGLESTVWVLMCCHIARATSVTLGTSI